ncbi:uncharacterized protein TNCV_1706961 [Trichonephila clavipes]|uniref:Uncharacterized protein n=1 Tax=Trichonephila clavipes TaxID=2585209 RepID=A0A8X6RD22_TRICX|nr:uncharacterized protein TNCV_1706961 [Trichonephila clavipes]
MVMVDTHVWATRLMVDNDESGAVTVDLIINLSSRSAVALGRSLYSFFKPASLESSLRPPTGKTPAIENILSPNPVKYLNSSLWRKIQETGLVKEYKEKEDIRNVSRIISALAYLPKEHIDDAWRIVWEKSFSIDKITPFIDYFVEQWMSNTNMPVKVWNVCGQHHRTNSVERWNSKLNAITGSNQPNVHLLVKILKEEIEKVPFNLKSRELGDP